MIRALAFITAIGAIVFLAAAGHAQKDDKEKPKKAVVSGTIECQAEAIFEPGTIARVSVQDVSKADAAATTIGEQVIKDLKKFPIAFAVEYDPAAIQPKSTYAVRVRIETGKRLDYINDTNVPVVEAEQIVDNLKRRGVPVEYILFEDEGHGFRKEKNRITSTVKLVEFFVDHLVGGQASR